MGFRFGPLSHWRQIYQFCILKCISNFGTKFCNIIHWCCVNMLDFFSRCLRCSMSSGAPVEEIICRHMSNERSWINMIIESCSLISVNGAWFTSLISQQVTSGLQIDNWRFASLTTIPSFASLKGYAWTNKTRALFFPLPKKRREKFVQM